MAGLIFGRRAPLHTASEQRIAGFAYGGRREKPDIERFEKHSLRVSQLRFIKVHRVVWWQPSNAWVSALTGKAPM
jgi:hypothetical protein